MARYSVHSMLVSLNVEDRPLRYTPAYGPPVDLRHIQRKRNPAASNLVYSNLGPRWTFDWLSYVSDDPNTQLPLTGLSFGWWGGNLALRPRRTSFRGRPAKPCHAREDGSASYERRMPDGSKQVFGLSDGAPSYPRRIFTTQIVDPAGNALGIGYDASFRVTTITDAPPKSRIFFTNWRAIL